MPRASRCSSLKIFGASLREIRRGARLTQVRLAEALGVSVSYVSLLERGERNPPLSRLLQIAAVLETTPVRLVESVSFSRQPSEACSTVAAAITA